MGSELFGVRHQPPAGKQLGVLAGMLHRAPVAGPATTTGAASGPPVEQISGGNAAVDTGYVGETVERNTGWRNPFAGAGAEAPAEVRQTPVKLGDRILQRLSQSAQRAPETPTVDAAAEGVVDAARASAERLAQHDDLPRRAANVLDEIRKLPSDHVLDALNLNTQRGAGLLAHGDAAVGNAADAIAQRGGWAARLVGNGAGTGTERLLGAAAQGGEIARGLAGSAPTAEHLATGLAEAIAKVLHK
ncbi:MAG: hypothetical protein JWN41_407 [Thermoleophilia bacterium]|nr:hypothetical protein [Thermoleophilia bacterium]